MKKIGTLAIIGTGLIGGSLGLAIRKKKLAGRVIGVSRRKESLGAAVRTGAIDAGSRDLSVIRGADMVIICLPVGEILRQAPRIVKLAGPDCLICDAGSTKTGIVSIFSRLTRRFVGCHPMAGSEKRGIENASVALFTGSFCILTKTRSTDPAAFAAAQDFWNTICGKTVVMAPEEHDRAMALVSHLPHAAAFALVNSVPQGLLKLAAGGFRDSTRLASSDEDIWSDIFLTNRRPLLAALTAFEKNLRAIRNAVNTQNARALRTLLTAAKTKRLSL